MNKLAIQRACTAFSRRAAETEKAQVHSVFKTALNIRLLKSGRMLVLLAAGRPLVPYAAEVCRLTDFTALGIMQGDTVLLQNVQLRLGGGASAAVVDFAPAAGVSLSAARLAGLCPPQNPRGALASLAGVIQKSTGAQMGIAPVLAEVFGGGVTPLLAEGNVYSSFFAPRAERLLAALRQKDEAACARLAPALAGCGPGLTPSSDDFLVGVAASLWGLEKAGCLQAGRGGMLAAALSGGAAEAAGDISAHFLCAAAEGLFAEDVLAVQRAFFVGDTRQLCAAAQQAAAFGASSGVDMLAGVWFCMAALLL